MIDWRLILLYFNMIIPPKNAKRRKKNNTHLLKYLHISFKILTCLLKGLNKRLKGGYNEEKNLVCFYNYFYAFVYF